MQEMEVEKGKPNMIEMNIILVHLARDNAHTHEETIFIVSTHQNDKARHAAYQFQSQATHIAQSTRRTQ